MKYYIQPTREGNRPDAGVKAVNDTYAILDGMGYKPLAWRSRWPIHALKYFSEKLFYRRMKRILQMDDIVLLQWPDYSVKYHQALYDILKRCCKVQILIHDINTLREFSKGDIMEMEFFRLADRLIVHSEAMKNYVCQLGVNPDRVGILTAFDYITDETSLPKRCMSKVIVYAGNLKKSIFLKFVNENVLDDCTINCYGKLCEDLGSRCVYKGIFEASHVSGLQGSWGLVWDGDSTNICSGIWGRYLKYNSPHKTSLYIVSCLPVIIWSKAAMADYIVNRGLGIVVESLADIPNKLNSIDESQYKELLENVEKEAVLLRQGIHLQSSLTICR